MSSPYCPLCHELTGEIETEGFEDIHQCVLCKRYYCGLCGAPFVSIEPMPSAAIVGITHRLFNCKCREAYLEVME